MWSGGGGGGAKKGDVEMAKVNSLSIMLIEPSMFLENPAYFDWSGDGYYDHIN